MSYIPRALENTLLRVSGQFPVLLLTGPRQVGKTTLLQHMAGGERRYVTLDDPTSLALARNDPRLFLETYAPPVLIDEIQYAPELLPHIKMLADRTQRPGLVWLTGSQQFHMMRNVSESLAGRVGIVQMLGFSQREEGGRLPDTPLLLPGDLRRATGPACSTQDIYACIFRGSFPAMVVDAGRDRDLFFNAYLRTYLQRDVRDLAQVGNLSTFLRFVQCVAARTGQLLNMADIARDADVAPNTAKHWLSILEASGLVYLLEPYFSNVTKRLVKRPKLYFLDTGLASWLCGWASVQTLEAGAMTGAILETWIVAELLKTWWNAGLYAPFYYYRDTDQREIDLLMVRDGTLYPLEFKKSASPSAKNVRHFSCLRRLDMPVGEGCVVCLVPEAIPLTENVWAIPASWI